MSHLLSLLLLTVDADYVTVRGYSEVEKSSFKHFPLLYVTLIVLSGNTFFMSGSFKTFSKFFFKGLYIGSN